MNVKVVASNLMAGALLCASAATEHEVVGLWVCNGTPGETATNETVFENQISRYSDLKMKVQHQIAALPLYQWPDPPRFTNDIPISGSTYLFPDCAMTNGAIKLTSSLHIGRGKMSDNYANYGSILMVPGVGKYLKDAQGNKQDFTLEILLRFDPGAESNGYNNHVIGLTAKEGREADSPILSLSPYKAGVKGWSVMCITNNQKLAGLGAGYMCYSRKYALTSCEWRHLAICYDAATGRARLCVNYWDQGFGNNNGTTISLTNGDYAINDIDDTVAIQVLGGFASDWHNNYRIKGADVAAVKFSKGLLRPFELMNVHRYDLSDKAKEPMPLAHWRFNGSGGEVVTNVADEVTGLDANVLMSGWSQDWNGSVISQNYFTYTNDFPGPFVALNGERKPNESDLSSTWTTGEQQALDLRLFDSPAYCSGSFTIEMWIRRDSANYPDDGTTSSQVLKYGTPFFCSTAWNLTAFYNKGFTDWFAAPAQGGWMANYPGYDQWTHVAMVYDESARTMTYYLHDIANKQLFKYVRTLQDGTVLWTPQANKDYFPMFNPFFMNNGSLRGAVDEFRITRGVLTPDQFITAHRTDGKSGLLLMVY